MNLTAKQIKTAFKILCPEPVRCTFRFRDTPALKNKGNAPRWYKCRGILKSVEVYDCKKVQRVTSFGGHTWDNGQPETPGIYFRFALVRFSRHNLIMKELRLPARKIQWIRVPFDFEALMSLANTIPIERRLPQNEHSRFSSSREAAD